MAEKKIRFGVSEVAFAPYDETTSEYGAWIDLSGATQLTLNPEGSTQQVYGDNITYYTGVKNSGYTGTITLLDIPDELRTKVFGEGSKDGMLYESTDALPANGCLRFKVDGNIRNERTELLNTTLSRPSGDNSTNEDTLSVKNFSMDFTSIGRDLTIDGATKNVVKVTVEDSTDGEANYDKMLTEVVTPADTTTSSAGA